MCYSPTMCFFVFHLQISVFPPQRCVFAKVSVAQLRASSPHSYRSQESPTNFHQKRGVNFFATNQHFLTRDDFPMGSSHTKTYEFSEKFRKNIAIIKGTSVMNSGKNPQYDFQKMRGHLKLFRKYSSVLVWVYVL